MPKDTAVTVSIVCFTYNQVQYVSQTLDSFLMQKTNFNFEILIHDDASTDGTTDIIKKYAAAHPKLFRLFIEEKNQFSLSNTQFFADLFSESRGKYIAFCEGDDYWTDENKLQKQVEYLDNNPKDTLCFHPVRVFFENSDKEYIYPTYSSESDFKVDNLLKNNFIQTNSIMYRNLKKYKELHTSGILPIDWYIHLYHAKYGNIGFINAVMSCYRRQESGVWWDAAVDKKNILLKYGDKHLAMYFEVLDLYKDHKEYKKIIEKNIMDMTFSIMDIKNEGYRILQNFSEIYPNFNMMLMDILYQAKIKEDDRKISLLEKTIKLKDNHIKNIEEISKDYKSQIDSYKDSLFFKSYNKLTRKK